MSLRSTRAALQRRMLLTAPFSEDLAARVRVGWRRIRLRPRRFAPPDWWWLPRLTQLVHKHPFELAAPEWVDDINFDVTHHVRWAALPHPGDDAAPFRIIADLMEHRLDRADRHYYQLSGAWIGSVVSPEAVVPACPGLSDYRDGSGLSEPVGRPPVIRPPCRARREARRSRRPGRDPGRYSTDHRHRQHGKTPAAARRCRRVDLVTSQRKSGWRMGSAGTPKRKHLRQNRSTTVGSHP